MIAAWRHLGPYTCHCNAGRHAPLPVDCNPIEPPKHLAKRRRTSAPWTDCPTLSPLRSEETQPSPAKKPERYPIFSSDGVSRGIPLMMEYGKGYSSPKAVKLVSRGKRTSCSTRNSFPLMTLSSSWLKDFKSAGRSCNGSKPNGGTNADRDRVPPLKLKMTNATKQGIPIQDLCTLREWNCANAMPIKGSKTLRLVGLGGELWRSKRAAQCGSSSGEWRPCFSWRNWHVNACYCS